MERGGILGELNLSSREKGEWDPKNWNWNGDLFIATPTLSLNQTPTTHTQLLFTNSHCNNSPSSDDKADGKNSDKGHHLVQRKKRLSLTVEEENEDVDSDESASGRNLTALNLGVRGGYANNNAGNSVSGKKTKSGVAGCQVEDCGADLSEAKGYHRRHKVCEMHSKATEALVANQMQRFCQQCSRFHLLQEFDEGKRSCRRRLAGHNKRRRKTQPGDSNPNPAPVSDNRCLVMTILGILSTIHSDRSNQKENLALLSYFLSRLAKQGSFHRDGNVSGHLPESLNLLDILSSSDNTELFYALHLNSSLGQASREHVITPIHEQTSQGRDAQATTSQSPGVVLPIQPCPQSYTQEIETSDRRNNFDLNDEYVDSDDGTDDIENPPVPTRLETVSVEYPSWTHQDSQRSSPPLTSGNSDSASALSPASSAGDARNYTDRIVFKLFEKEPNDLPLVLRSQIFDWLSQSPSDIESYIRPGCIVLTIYLRQAESAWEELCVDLSSSLSRLFNFSGNIGFWNTGWIYVMVRNQMAFSHNGQVVADASLPFETGNYCTILNVRPIAVTSSTQTQFFVKGLNVSRYTARLHCALEGNYLQADNQSVEHANDYEGKVQCLKISYSIPALTGRGFIEIEEFGIGSSFFPFIVAEDNVCTEIRMLEKEIETTEMDYSNQQTGSFAMHSKAMEFIHEMGWLLHKFQSKSRFGHEDPDSGSFTFERFKYLVEFAMDRGWCAVVSHLLDVLLYGVVSSGEQPLLTFSLSELGLLHRAVRRNSRSLVEMLLRYVPVKVADELSSEYKSLLKAGQNYLFRPDVVGTEGLTPLHVAAARDGSEETLDALTEDPGKAGIGAWKNALDSAGLTPEDCARLRGRYSYIHLVQRKIDRSGHVVVDISDSVSDSIIKHKADAATGFEILGRSKTRKPCGIYCAAQNGASAYYRHGVVYRPAMLSMLAVAVVCVCVALYFKTLPHVLYMFHPFSWEMLEYGSS